MAAICVPSISTLVRSVSKTDGTVLYGGSSSPAPVASPLPYDENSLVFHFSATSFCNKNKNEYRYLLEGYDKDWSPWTQESKKEYTNLPEGDYHFRVQGKNTYGTLGSAAGYRFRVSLEDRDAPQLMVYALNSENWQGVTRISIDEDSLFNDPEGRIKRAKDLPPGNWIFTVQEQSGRLKPASGTIVVTRGRDAALPVAILAAFTSLLLFVYSWWAVRQGRPSATA